jgi:hypothetical protein
MPWVHYGILSVLTRRTDFLLEFNFTVNGREEIYDEVCLEKIIRHFTWKADPDDPLSPEHPIFVPTRDESGAVISLDLVIGKFTLIMMPRGFSKTTLINAVNLWFIGYQECNFPAYISKTGKHASKQLSSITKQFSGNELFKSVFGQLKPVQRNDEGLRWSESEGFIQTTTGVSVLAVGAQGQIRGMLDDGKRPDRLIIDDIEDKENTKTDERRESTRDWFFGDLLPVLPELDPNATATMLCNLVHLDSIGVHLMADPQWTVIKFGPIDLDDEPLWPELLDHDKLDIKKQSYALQAQLSTFYLEYFNEIRNLDTAKFRPDFFIYIPRISSDLVRKSIAIDPAISKNKRADSCTIGITGMTSTGHIHVMDIWGKQGAEPNEMIEQYFDMAQRYKMNPADYYTVETNGFQASLISPMQEEMFRRQFFFEILRISQSQDKIERVEGVLQPRYANGFITHQRRFGLLETQLLDWPNGKRDYPDVISIAIAAMNPSLPLMGMTSGKSLADDQYLPLEEIFEGDWREF